MKQAKPKCAVCKHHRGSVFSALSRALLLGIDRAKTFHTYSAGQLIFSEGTPAFAVHGIHSGFIKLYKTGSRGEQQVIRVLGPGDTMGFRPILAGEAYAASAQALERTTTCIIPKEAVIELVRLSPRFSLRLLAEQVRELRVSEEQLIALAQQPVKQRAVRVLLSLMEKTSRMVLDRSGTGISIRKKEIAQIVGTTPETLSRTLRELSRLGIVRLSRDGIRVVDPPALKELAGR